MPDTGKAVALVITLTVFALLGAVLAPVAINQIENPTNETIQQDTGETVELNGDLNTTLDSTTAGTSATYTLQTSDESITNTVNVGSNTTYSFNEGDVVVGVTESTSDNATAYYEYPKDFAYSDGASSLWGLLGLAIVLALMLYSIRQAMAAAP